jgi:omega-3 fatty acid desaturase (delta-15 desaturase)
VSASARLAPEPNTHPEPTLRALRDALPERCLRPNAARAFLHLGVDLAAVAGLYAVLAQLEAWWALPPVWFALGTFWWALFLVGHDCGHHAFSARRRTNVLVGHLLHTPLLVPFHAWQISHRRHHAFTGHVERDEAWFPLSDAELAALPRLTRALRLHAPILLLPFYLLRNSPARAGSHFDASGPLFRDAERARVRRSVRCCAAFAAGLLAAGALLGPGFVVKFWLGPYLFFAGWLGLVTFLNHTHPELDWYRGGAWTPVRGALTTMDRSFGLFERIHHDVGSHTAHHLFPRIPHYRLREASAALRPLLGERMRRDETPFWRAYPAVLRRCQAVPAEGDVVRARPWSGAVVTSAASYRPAPSGAGSSPATT